MIEKLQQVGERLVMLRTRLKARKGRAGYERNCAELEAEIERLEKFTADAAEPVLTPAEETELVDRINGSQNLQPDTKAIGGKRKPE